MNVPGLVAEPAGLRILTTPVEAPGGIVNTTWVALTLVGTVTMLPSMTPTVPARLVPVMVTLVPTGPFSGLRLVIVGGDRTVNAPTLVALPLADVTWIVPVDAPGGTVKVSSVAERLLKAALVPLSFTCVTSVRLVPVTVTVACAPPADGVN